jgi:5-(aminomethyl)-3-furanmethanol phosphate kinase
MPAQASRASAAPLAAAAGLIVVKLGGSVVRSGACQSQLGFGDKAAHRMALLAMDQLAWAVAGLGQGLAVGATEPELRAVLERGQVAVWAPYALVAERSDIEASWRLTSDSLALWLARRLGAVRCYLVKSIVRKGDGMSARQLARDGVVDAAFPDMLRDAGMPAFLLGRGDQHALAACLAGQSEHCGAAID